MSYLATLVAAPTIASTSRPAVSTVDASSGADTEPSLEQDVEIDAPPTREAAPPAQVQPVANAWTTGKPARGATEAAAAQPSASVEDALRAAFAWVAPPADAKTLSVPAQAPAEAPSPTSQRDRAVQPVGTGEAIGSVRPERAAPPVDSPARIAHAREWSRGADHIEVRHAVEDAPRAAESEPVHARDPAPQRPPLPAATPTRQVRTVAHREPPAAPRARSLEVRIGSISLHVRTPQPSPPFAPPAPVAAPVATEPSPRAPSPAFAFSARRHHLRWG